MNEQTQKYEQLLSEAGDEIDRLNLIIRDKNKYLEAWQTRFKELELSRDQIQQQLSINQ